MKLTQSFYQSLDEWIDVSVSEPVNIFDIKDLSHWDLDSFDADGTEELEELFFTMDA